MNGTDTMNETPDYSEEPVEQSSFETPDPANARAIVWTP
jgi:hypothetical protein